AGPCPRLAPAPGCFCRLASAVPSPPGATRRARGPLPVDRTASPRRVDTRNDGHVAGLVALAGPGMDKGGRVMAPAPPRPRARPVPARLRPPEQCRRHWIRPRRQRRVRMQGLKDEWTNGRMDEWTNGRMDEWTKGRKDGRTE